jgi:glycosyltransferase involved in cell wall biosynthesis
MSVAGRAAVGGKDDPWLSILVPAYNVEAYVRECLESAIRQATGGVEVIVVDDCSTDRTADVIEEIQAANPGRLRVERLPENGGVYKARIRLLELARGDYVWLVDADDRIKEGAVASLNSIVAEHAPDFVICDFSVLGVRNNSWRRSQLKKRVAAFRGAPRRFTTDRSALVKGMLDAQQMQVWSKVFRRSLVDASTRLPQGRHFEDIAFSLIVALKSSSFYYEPTPWIDYRRTPNSIVATMTPAKHVEMARALAMAGGALESHRQSLSRAAAFAFRYFCARHFIRSLRGLLRYPADPEQAGRLRECLECYRLAVDDQVVPALDLIRRGRLVTWLKLVVWKARARRVIRHHAGRTARVPHPDTAA